MSLDKRTREKKLIDLLEICNSEYPSQLDLYINCYYKVDRGAILRGIAHLHEYRGLKAYFIDNDLKAMRQQFYMTTILLKASREESFNSGFRDNSFPDDAFVYALLSDSQYCINLIANAELAYKNDVRSGHFYARMLQLLLLDEHASIREMIALGAKKCGKPFREKFASGTDFFSLFLSGDKSALEAYIKDSSKIKSAHINRDFFANWAVIHTKLCWIKGVKVEIDHPLVPMPLMPVAPLDHYEIEYDFLLPDWTPPKPGLMEKIKRWVN